MFGLRGTDHGDVSSCRFSLATVTAVLPHCGHEKPIAEIYNRVGLET